MVISAHQKQHVQAIFIYKRIYEIILCTYKFDVLHITGLLRILLQNGMKRIE